MEASDVLQGGELPPVAHTYRTQELFLFSAATWNPHRVHYDESYAAGVEGHDSLLVQGPLQAVHMFQALSDALVEGARLTSVRYRHLAPLHAGQPVVVTGRLTDVDPDTRSATVEVRMEVSETGQQTTTGSAVVHLDDRAGTEGER
ncbi:MAG: hypothetical protein J2P24_14550 [Streptosporangiales bacterium]|nr:hypothetical protein [Streptosporangiales bacterium]MBO0889929.1 hypothetical protein [Acidothermales bacterium]